MAKTFLIASFLRTDELLYLEELGASLSLNQKHVRMVPRGSQHTRFATTARLERRRVVRHAEQRLGQLQRERSLTDPLGTDEQVRRRQPASRERLTELFNDGVVTLDRLPHGRATGQFFETNIETNSISIPGDSLGLNKAPLADWYNRGKRCPPFHPKVEIEEMTRCQRRRPLHRRGSSNAPAAGRD